MSEDEVYTYILAQAGVSELERFGEAIKTRRGLLAQRTGAGSTVKIANLSPKYLNGLTGQIVARQGNRVTVKLDHPVYMPGKFYGRSEIGGIPAQCALPV